MASFSDRVRNRSKIKEAAEKATDRESAPRHGIRASAQRLNLRSQKALKRQVTRRQDWQDEAWDYFDDIGEIKYPIRLAGNVMSKLRFYIAVRPLDEPEGDPIAATDPGSGIPPALAMRAEAELQRLKSPYGGRAEIVRMLYMNLEVSGEAYLVCFGPRLETDENGEQVVTEEAWEIKSVDEIEVVGKKVKVIRFPGDSGEDLDPDKGDDIIRIWTRHPRWSYQPDNALRGVLGICESVTLLENQIKADAKSHASAGIVLFPMELEQYNKVETNPAEGEGDEVERGPTFREAFDETLGEPVENPSSAAAVAPMPVWGPADILDHVKHIQFARTSDAGLDARIEGRILRIARGLNFPVETTLGHQQCADAATQVLSADGWKSHDDLEQGDEILTLNHDTGLAEWQIVERVTAYDVERMPMVSLEGRNHSSLTTLDHHWPILNGDANTRWWVDSIDLKGHHKIVTGASLIDHPAEPKWSDAFVELIAWYWTEGTFDRRSGSVSIFQSERANPDCVGRIRAALTTMFGSASTRMHAATRAQNLCRFAGCEWPVHSHGLCDAHHQQQRAARSLRPVRRQKPRPTVSTQEPAWRETKSQNEIVRFVLNKPASDLLHDVAPDKVVSRTFLRSLTAAQVELFVQASVDADGNRHKNGDALYLKQADRARLDAWDFACVLTGRSLGTYERREPCDDVTIGGVATTSRTQWQSRASRPRPQKIRNMTREIVEYTGTVWCPTVPNGTWFARRDGKSHFTGNTTFANAAVIEEDKFKEHYEPGAITICDAWTAGVLQPNLIDAGEDPDLVGRLFVWYDPGAMLRGVEPHETADRGWDIGAISDEAWRRVNGWTEDDAPDAVELMLRVALFRIRTLDPGLSTAIIELLGIPLDIPSAVPAGPQPADTDVPQPPGGQDNPTPPTESIDPRLLPALNRRGPGLESALLQWFLAKQQGVRPDPMIEGIVRAAATPEAIRAATRSDRGARVGRRFMDIDRELRTRLATAAHTAMVRAIEKAGNRLKASAPTGHARRSEKRGQSQREIIRKVAPRYAAATLGRELVASAGFTGDDLIGPDAWQSLQAQFETWVANAQARALQLTATVVPMTTAQKAFVQDRQAAHRAEAWEWLENELAALAQDRLYQPDPIEPSKGEFDPSSSVPMGMIRQALARAGGATRLSAPNKGIKAAAGDDLGSFVVVNNNQPPGGVATGQDLSDVLDAGGAGTEGYVWDYGPAIRKAPFEDHEALDGQSFADWDSDVLDASSSWIDSTNFFPGDHDGCACDVVPVILAPDETAFNEVTGEAFYTQPTDDATLLMDQAVAEATAEEPPEPETPAPRSRRRGKAQ